MPTLQRISPLTIDRRASSDANLNALSDKRRQNPVAIPTRLESLKHDGTLKAIVGMDVVARQCRNAHARELRQRRAQLLRVRIPFAEPALQLAQLKQADRRLHLEHAPVAPDAVMDPSIAHGMIVARRGVK